MRKRFGKIRGADRHHHEFLEVDGIVGMRAAIDDIHHRHRQDARARATDIAEQRQARGLRGSLGDRERYAQHRVRAEARLVLGAVQRNQRFIDLGLIGSVHAADRIEDFAVRRIDRLAHALAEITRLVPIAELDRFMGSGRCPGRYGGPAARAVFEGDVDFDRRIAAAVEDFAGVNVDNGGHGDSEAGGCGF
jgi:hypothetical protein